MRNSRLFIAIGIACAVIIAIEGAYLFFLNYRGKTDDTDVLLSACHSLSSPLQCWSDAIDAIMEKRGIDIAFESVAKLYDTEPGFAQACHSFTHKVGAEAYKKFAQKQDFAISPKTAYCGYGFYHGFMEELLQDSGDFEQARKFCSYVNQKLAALTPDAELQCFHGIGHGTVNDHNRKDWGNERALVGPALILCEKVSQTMLQLYRCASGVFNGLAIFYTDGEYGLAIKRDDPLWLCREQKKEYQEACYGNMNVALLWLTKQDFASSARFIERIVPDDEAIKAIRYLAAPIGAARQQENDFASEISDCRSLQSRLRLSCIQGFAFGMLEHGPPGNEYAKPLKFCEKSKLNESEQKACFDYLFSYLGIWYPKEKAEDICAIAVPSRREYCLQAVRQTIKERSH